MGKKNVNPADAHRKKQRKKEIEKNKATRKAAREMAVVHRDTTKTEREIDRLQELASQRQLDKNGQAKLKSLKEELDKVIKAKEAHGIKPQSSSAAGDNASDESRKLVFDPKKGAFVPISKKKQQRMEAKNAKSKQNEGSDDSEESDDDSDDDESEDDILPELPVFKGEDLIEEEEEAKKAAVAEMEEATQDNDEQINDDQDVPMPDGDDEEEEDSDIESIPMPKGPPPTKPFERQIPTPAMSRPPPPPPGGPGRHYRPPPPPPGGPGRHYRPPTGYRPPPPPSRPPLHNQYAHHYGQIPQYGFAPPPAVPGPPAQSTQDFSMDIAYAVQEHIDQREPSLVEGVEASTTPAVTISAAPQVRDLQKELVGFVPAAVRKKQLQAGKKGTVPKVARPTINAAPDMDNPIEAAPSSIQLPAAPTTNTTTKTGDEYERFMREMQGIL